MKTFERIFSKILIYGTLLSTVGLLATVSLQIFARFVLAQAPSWTEEASRLFFIYAISFASGLAVKEQYYVALDFFFEKFSPKLQQILKVLIPISIFVLFSIMAIYALPFIIQGHAESSPSMGMKMSLAFASMFVMAASIAFYAMWEIFFAPNKKSL